MVYAKGHEEDEKLHKTFHSSAVQGLKFQVPQGCNMQQQQLCSS